MKRHDGSTIQTWLTWIRTAILGFTGLVMLLWISSYFIGVQRYQSNWSSLDGTTFERATWLVSNDGSVGFAWRSQDGKLGAPLPPSEYQLKTFDSSPSALDHVHPKGTSSWHWLHYKPAESKTMGSMRTGYGHFYVPYWMLFLVGGLSAFMLTVWIKKSTKTLHPTTGNAPV